jgi:hypothetical protein
MKKLICFVVLLSVVTIIQAQTDSLVSVKSKKDSIPWFKRALTLNTELRLGNNYSDLFGAKLTKNIALFSVLDVSHDKSGVGVALYRLDDFSKEQCGRIGFVDLYWAGVPVKNLFLYAAAEYGWWDNWRDGQFWSGYTILEYSLKRWSFMAAPIYIYYDRLGDHQFMFKGQVSCEVVDGFSLRVAGWYDNLYQSSAGFYGAVGLTLKLPANTYFQADLLLKEKIDFALGFGWKFSSK